MAGQSRRQVTIYISQEASTLEFRCRDPIQCHHHHMENSRNKLDRSSPQGLGLGLGAWSLGGQLQQLQHRLHTFISSPIRRGHFITWHQTAPTPRSIVSNY